MWWLLKNNLHGIKINVSKRTNVFTKDISVLENEIFFKHRYLSNQLIFINITTPTVLPSFSTSGLPLTTLQGSSSSQCDLWIDSYIHLFMLCIVAYVFIRSTFSYSNWSSYEMVTSPLQCPYTTCLFPVKCALLFSSRLVGPQICDSPESWYSCCELW